MTKSLLWYRVKVLSDAADFSLEVFDDHMLKSKGTPTMSDEDVKMCLLELRWVVTDFKKQIQLLTEELEPKPKKSFVKKLLRK